MEKQKLTVVLRAILSGSHKHRWYNYLNQVNQI